MIRDVQLTAGDICRDATGLQVRVDAVDTHIASTFPFSRVMGTSGYCGVTCPATLSRSASSGFTGLMAELLEPSCSRKRRPAGPILPKAPAAFSPVANSNRLTAFAATRVLGAGGSTERTN